jgi:L-histidine N-alpha-methyltransferase
MMERLQLLQRLERVMEETEFGWSLLMVGEDQSRKLADLTNDLKRPYSTTGDGKQILSGYSYWGIEPAIAWQHACRDPYYPVMKDGIDSFTQRWNDLQPALHGARYHYVSLGPGTGDKDRAVLHTMQPSYPEMLYVPVDMSAEMLRMCLQPIRDLPFIKTFRRQLLPVQLDFSDDENLDELQALRERLMDDEPIIWGLLGNTAANFEDDFELIERLATLLRPQDLLMLEVATTTELAPDVPERTSTEYLRSKAFCEFVTSALHQHTDLPINLDNLEISGEIVSDRCVLIKTIYHHRNKDARVTLPDRTVITLRQNDTVRLYVSRKYAPAALHAELRSIGLGVKATADTTWAVRHKTYRFGLQLLLLAKGGDTGPVRTAARDLFRDG